MENNLGVNKFKRESEIKSMISYSDELVNDVSRLHSELLLGKDRMLKFQILVKFFLELTYSCLDYLAMDIYEKYGKEIDAKNVSFPFVEYRKDEEMINSEMRLIRKMEKTIGFGASNDLLLIHKIRNYQHLYHQNHNIWVTDFRILRNHNVHRNLSLYEEKIDSDRILNIPNRGKIIFKGECSGVNIAGVKIYRSKNELEEIFNQPILENVTRYYVFTDVHEINKEAIKFIKVIKEEVKKIVVDMYEFLNKV